MEIMEIQDSSNILSHPSGRFLVRLWSTYRVHFCRRHRRRRRRRPQHRPIGMYDSSNESSQRTE